MAVTIDSDVSVERDLRYVDCYRVKSAVDPNVTAVVSAALLEALADARMTRDEGHLLEVLHRARDFEDRDDGEGR